MSNSLRIEGHKFLKYVILSCQCALHESKFWIILAISYWEKVIEDKKIVSQILSMCRESAYGCSLVTKVSRKKFF